MFVTRSSRAFDPPLVFSLSKNSYPGGNRAQGVPRLLLAGAVPFSEASAGYPWPRGSFSCLCQEMHWDQLGERMAGSGQLTTYLGTAPGVGKTYAMLTEGRRRAATGEHVVVGWVEHHDRPETMRQVGDLEVIGPGHVDYRGHDFAEMDWVISAAGADLVVVDELAHSLPDGSRRRWAGRGRHPRQRDRCPDCRQRGQPGVGSGLRGPAHRRRAQSSPSRTSLSAPARSCWSTYLLTLCDGGSPPVRSTPPTVWAPLWESISAYPTWRL